MRRTVLSLAICLFAVLSGCQHLDPPVEVAQSELGRVVVYRNGIAYYERKARVDGDKLSLRVPADKVDDFLKSLTVADVKTGKPLPISFPSRSAQTDGAVDMAIQLPDRSRREVKLTYITEAPAWKPSYRIVVGGVDKAGGGQVDLEGWAIVDNTSGEDWTQVKVGVGASSALSFRYDLHSIRTVQRETLSQTDTFAKAPPRGGSVVADSEIAAKDEVVGELKADELPTDLQAKMAMATAGDATALLGGAGSGGMGFRGVGDGGGGKGLGRLHGLGVAERMNQPHAAAGPAPSAPPAKTQGNISAVQQLAQNLKAKNAPVTIEGYASSGESEPADKSTERANTLRNQLIELGVPPAQVQISARGVVAGQSAGVRVVEQKAPGGKDAQATQPATPVGESHFESPGPMTVGKGTSAMVSIVRSKAAGEVVYLYDGESGHGDDRFAFRAVRFQNPTTSTLEAGPLTVYGAGRFIGEGLTDPIPPGATAVVPYALDRQVVVVRDAAVTERMDRLVKLARGVLTAEVQHVRTTKLKVTNRLQEKATLLVRHTVQPGWNVTKSPKQTEQFGDARLYAVQLGAGETQEVVLEEATPLQRTVDLRAPEGLDLVRVWLTTANPQAEVAAQMKQVLALHDDLTRLEETIEHLRERQGEFRERAEELQGQIFSLKLVRTAGPLMAHLQQKMKDTSEQVQRATVQIVDAEEKRMLARVKFQDSLAELTLAKQAARK